MTTVYRSENLLIRVIVDAVANWKVNSVVLAFTSSNVLKPANNLL